MINKHDWFRIKRYPHIGLPLTLHDRLFLNSYVHDKDKIAKHAFLPFIHKKKASRRFRKRYDDNGVLLNDGRREANIKERDLYYASHFDANIFSYYAFILNKLYEDKIQEIGINQEVTAYRRIPVTKWGSKPRIKCNIDFADEVFRYIRNSKSKQLIAIAFDIKSFFENLDHQLLKEQWCSLLNTDNLPPDHYNIFRNITKFSYVKENEIFNLFKDEIISKTKSGITRTKKISKSKYLKNQQAIAYCRKEQFLNAKAEGKIKVKANKFKDKERKELRRIGIPQGSPISAVLANIYMLNFDSNISKKVTELGAMYRRYSDDMIVIGELNDKDLIINLFNDEIRNVKLTIQPQKTQKFHFIKEGDSFYCFNETRSGNILSTKRFEYLGFEFDGQHTFLKSSSIAKYYRKFKRSMSRSTYYAKYTKNEESRGEIFRHRIYKHYSYLGSKRRCHHTRDRNDPNLWSKHCRYDWGNYLTYGYKASRLMEQNKIKAQLRNHWKIVNNLIMVKQTIINSKHGIK